LRRVRSDSKAAILIKLLASTGALDVSEGALKIRKGQGDGLGSEIGRVIHQRSLRIFKLIALIASEWGASENNRRARFYRLTREGRKQLQVETQDWEQTAAIIGRFFEVKAEDLS